MWPRFVFILLLLSTAVPRVWSDEYGSISGRITEPQSGSPVAYAQVVLLGTHRGGMAVEDGTYVLKNVPAGVYDVKVMMMGFEDQTQKGVVVAPGRETRVDFVIEQTVVDIDLGQVVVRAPPYIDQMNTNAQTVQEVDAEIMTSIPVDDVVDVIALNPGVIARAGQLYVRGERGDGVQIQVDGIPVTDPLVGGGYSPAMLALESAEMIIGGLEAQYGNAKSGVINYKTKEGRDEFEGEIRYSTDDYGAPDNTFDNLDRLFLGFGGPSPIRDLTYYISAEAIYQDDYPKTHERRSRRRILNFISIGDRKSNSLKVQSKLAYRPTPQVKMTVEVINDHSKRDTYHHMWNWEGFVETFFDTTRTGTVVRRHGSWSQTAVDSTYEHYNAAEHTPNVLQRFNQLKFVLNHTINEGTFYSFKASRVNFFQDRRVQGKEPWEYEGAQESDFWFNYRDAESSDFFVVAGDYPFLSTRETTVLTSKLDVTRLQGKHRIQTGFEIDYNDMRYFQVERPYRTGPSGEIGFPNTRYHYYNPEGAIYVQDQWEHEGMVLNVGLRFDALSVGNQISIGEVRNRWKTQWSPRVGIAYPISDSDVFSFHYGRFYQFPERQYVFDDRNVFDGRARGNPNLENETSISYQAGIQHLFSEIVFGQFSVYYRDVFGIVTAEESLDPAGTGNVVIYKNKDYASSRGFEFSLMRRFRDGFRGELSYTFGVATGVASDPNAAVSQNFIYLPVSEQPLRWDARHQLSTHLYVADPGSWGVDMVWTYTSGFPYTPVQRHSRELGPEAVHSRRLPSSTLLNVNVEKYYSLWGQRLKFFVTARNLLDTKNITSLAPGDILNPPAFIGRDYEIYYTETGRAGGAYLGDDVDGDGIEDWVALHDPLVFGEPRAVRMGVGLQF
jgi:outer membrane receptor for ferrienterochelin and colicin